jgi:Flp pilus assembly protein TadG
VYIDQGEHPVKTQNQKIGQRGAAAVEFAIILPLLVILVFGIIDIGLLLYNKQIITNASREGARAGIARSTSVTNIVNNYCTGRLFLNGSSPPTTNVTGGGAFQNDLTVTVTYDHNLMFAGIIGLSPSITIKGQTVMKMEPIPPPSS